MEDGMEWNEWMENSNRLRHYPLHQSFSSLDTRNDYPPHLILFPWFWQPLIIKHSPLPHFLHLPPPLSFPSPFSIISSLQPFPSPPFCPPPFPYFHSMPFLSSFSIIYSFQPPPSFILFLSLIFIPCLFSSP